MRPDCKVSPGTTFMQCCTLLGRMAAQSGGKLERDCHMTEPPALFLVSEYGVASRP